MRLNGGLTISEGGLFEYIIILQNLTDLPQPHLFLILLNTPYFGLLHLSLPNLLPYLFHLLLLTPS